MDINPDSLDRYITGNWGEDRMEPDEDVTPFWDINALCAIMDGDLEKAMRYLHKLDFIDLMLIKGSCIKLAKLCESFLDEM